MNTCSALEDHIKQTMNPRLVDQNQKEIGEEMKYSRQKFSKGEKRKEILSKENIK